MEQKPHSQKHRQDEKAEGYIPEELNGKQTKMNNTINEIKNTLEGINSRITEGEEWISDPEDKTVEIITTEENTEKRMKRIEDRLRDIWDNIKSSNIRTIGVPEEEEEKKKVLRKYLKRL